MKNVNLQLQQDLRPLGGRLPEPFFMFQLVFILTPNELDFVTTLIPKSSSIVVQKVDNTLELLSPFIIFTLGLKDLFLEQ